MRGEWGLFLAGYATAVEDCLHGPRKIVAVGKFAESDGVAFCPSPTDVVQSPRTDLSLADLVRRAYVPNAFAMVVEDRRPLLDRLGLTGVEEGAAHLCDANRCLAPPRRRSSRSGSNR